MTSNVVFDLGSGENGPRSLIHHGDCIEVMASMPADSVDAVVTDPPYGLEFMGKAWDSMRPAVSGRNDLRGATKGERDAGGEFGKRIGISYGVPKKNPRCKRCYKLQHDHPKAKCKCENPDWDVRGSEYGYAMQWWHEAWGREALRVTKPGGYLLAFGGTRTHHRLVCGLEDAGWIIRDELTWVYAQGFPKGKANLKPAHEPIVLARKPGPLRPLAIDATRIPSTESWNVQAASDFAGDGGWGDAPRESHPAGRWPSNLLLSDPELFDVANPYVVGSGAVTSVPATYQSQPKNEWQTSSYPGSPPGDLVEGYGDSGGYSRFFIVPKADRADREPVLRGQLAGGEARTLPSGYAKERGEGWSPPLIRENQHPTVKPVDLMRHLVRLVTPVGGLVLDPFLGSGSTAIACELEGFPWIGIEKEAEYVAIAEARLNGTQRGLGLA